MTWIAPYRDIILRESAPLLDAGLSYLGEDENSMTYMDRHVVFKFSVERYSESLSVLVRFLSSEPPDDELYGLHIIMTVYFDRDVADLLEVKDGADRQRVVRGYVRFIAEHKQTPFGQNFPLAAPYRAYCAAAARKIADMFATAAAGPASVG